MRNLILLSIVFLLLSTSFAFAWPGDNNYYYDSWIDEYGRRHYRSYEPNYYWPPYPPPPPPNWRAGPWTYEYYKDSPDARLNNRFNGNPPPGIYYYDRNAMPRGARPDAELNLGGGRKAWYFGPYDPVPEPRRNNRYPPGHLW